MQLLGPSAGGIRRHVAALALGLPAHGWAASVTGPHEVMRDLAHQDHAIDIPPPWQPSAHRSARRRLAAALGSVDLLHVHGLKAARVALTVEHRPPMVLTVHNLVGGTQQRTLRPVLERLESAIVERADHLVVISDEIDERFASLVPPDRRTFVLPASPPRRVTAGRDEVRVAAGIAPDAPLVTVVARHHRQKNLPMFLRAMRRVADTMPSVRALVVGDGPERMNLVQLAGELGLDDVVVFAGFRPNPVDEMHAADVVALSSDWEGSPLVVAECLAAGRPLVTTAVGTVSRHLRDGVSARITPVGDVDAFAAAIVGVLADPARAADLARAGHAVGERIFDADRLVGSVAEVYEQVLASPRI